MQSANSEGQAVNPMNILTVDMKIVIDSPSTSSTSSSPDSQTDTIPPFSRQNSQSDTLDTLDTASTSSLSTLAVKFAPLPTIGPRKRRSDQPLGMAARAQLVSKKRGRQRQNGELVISSSPMWSNAELDEQRKRIEIMAARHAEFQARENAQEVSRHCDELEDDRPEKVDSSDVGMEDPILVIGKIVKVAGKTLWNRVSGSKSETTTTRRERLRDLSPMPILIKSVPPEPVPPARTADANAWKESTQEPEPRCQNDVEKIDQSPTALEPNMESRLTSSPPPDLRLIECSPRMHDPEDDLLNIEHLELSA